MGRCSCQGALVGHSQPAVSAIGFRGSFSFSSIAAFVLAAHRQYTVFLRAAAWSICALYRWLKPELLPDDLALRGAHERDKLLGEAGVVRLAGDSGQHGNGRIEPGGNG